VIFSAPGLPPSQDPEPWFLASIKRLCRVAFEKLTSRSVELRAVATSKLLDAAPVPSATTVPWRSI
jgi:hypothetical protein